jgi:hypothetical protein
MINPLSQRSYQSTGNIIPLLEETSAFSGGAIGFCDLFDEMRLNFDTIPCSGPFNGRFEAPYLKWSRAGCEQDLIFLAPRFYIAGAYGPHKAIRVL